MSVRVKIIMVVLPLLILSMVLLGASSALSARSGITRLAIEFLGFKAEEMEAYANNQWDLLVNNGLEERQDLVNVTRLSVGTHAIEMVRSATELSFAVEGGRRVAFATRPLEREQLGIQEWAALQELYTNQTRGWVELSVRGEPRVGYAFFFEPFDWTIVISETEETFYATVNTIVGRTVIITAIVVMIATGLLIFFVGVLTRPLGRVVSTMDSIIGSSDLSARVEVEYQDEIGKLAHTFNTMMEQLEVSYQQAKEYALNAVLARRNEHKIRNIFQKYVPKDIIDSFFENPESMLVGDTREVAILFSDVRSFTTISETFKPAELVAALNRYFTILVDIIMDTHGIVDKYIGDAVMAFFGAPVSRENDARDAVDSAVRIVEALDRFNGEQREAGKPAFLTGLGINYGEVTVGNIGSERKMDYTVIGDNVNLASRLEGLTKYYRQPLIISHSVASRVQDAYPCRQIDTVVVKGKTVGEKIYTTRRTISDAESRAWELHASALAAYYDRDFAGARSGFSEVASLLSEDYISQMFIERCDELLATPPGPDWTGANKMDSK